MGGVQRQSFQRRLQNIHQMILELVNPRQYVKHYNKI
jgi:hypothetical protein